MVEAHAPGRETVEDRGRGLGVPVDADVVGAKGVDRHEEEVSPVGPAVGRPEGGRPRGGDQG
jgi:hypothetical protein